MIFDADRQYERHRKTSPLIYILIVSALVSGLRQVCVIPEARVLCDRDRTSFLNLSPTPTTVEYAQFRARSLADTFIF